MPTTQPTGYKATFQRFHDALNTRDLEIISKTIDELVHPDVRFHAPAPMDATGPQALKQVWTVLLRAFPDIQVQIEDMIAEGDKVVCRNTVRATHLGEYRGHPATGNFITYNEIFIVRFDGDRITEIWGVVDALSQMRQLGMMEQ